MSILISKAEQISRSPLNSSTAKQLFSFSRSGRFYRPKKRKYTFTHLLAKASTKCLQCLQRELHRSGTERAACFRRRTPLLRQGPTAWGPTSARREGERASGCRESLRPAGTETKTRLGTALCPGLEATISLTKPAKTHASIVLGQ